MGRSPWVGRVGCGSRCYAVAGVSGCSAWYGRVGVWGDRRMLFGFFSAGGGLDLGEGIGSLVECVW